MDRQEPVEQVPPDPAHLGVREDQIPPHREPPDPPAVAVAANDVPAQADVAAPETTQNDESLGTTPELIKDMGKGKWVWLMNGQSATPPDSPAVMDPTLPTKSSDSEEPKQSTTDSSPPTSMDLEDGKQAAPGEGGPDASPLTVSTVGSLPTSKHPRRKNKSTADTNHSQDSSSDPDTENQRMKRPPKKNVQPVAAMTLPD